MFLCINYSLCHVFTKTLRGPSQERQASQYLSYDKLIGTWLSSHDCPNLELRHHQKFAVFVILNTLFITFCRQNYTFSFLQCYSINMQNSI